MEAVRIEGHELRVSASIGISVFPDTGTDGGTLFKNADIALYRAKNEGRSRPCCIEVAGVDSPQ
jgi:diguanylate cyclase (GGDEF)-like protein